MPSETADTWNDAEPPALAPVGFLARVQGAYRLVWVLFLSFLIIVLFLVGRFLRGLLGRWVVFHFGAARLYALLVLRACGLRLRVIGKPIPSGALVANHSSWLDVPALRAVCLIYFVSKAEVARWPGVGFLSRITGTIFIERRRSQAKRQEAVLRERIAARQLLCLFPEGTSTDGLRVLEFKSSLFSAFFTDGTGAEIWVQPVSVRFLPAEGLPRCFYGWWGSMGFERHIWDVLTRSRGGVVEVIFHPAVAATDFASRKTLADHCKRVVEAGWRDGMPYVARPCQGGPA